MGGRADVVDAGGDDGAAGVELLGEVADGAEGAVEIAPVGLERLEVRAQLRDEAPQLRLVAVERVVQLA